ncbi:MAG: 50S ribosomal protein L19e [Candidatus Thorarchaeota archaeon]|jgi:large subunit ribosomal protein L19e
MKLTTQKRLAADVMKVGISRVWIDPEFEDEVSLAITRNDIRRLVDEGAIQRKQKIGVSRGRARHPMRKELKKLREEGKITRRVYRDLYLKAKGNAFRNTAHLRTYIAEHKLGAKR